MRLVLANSSIGMGAAVDALQAGHSALDAVERGIRQVELDRTNRSVGITGWPNMLGQVELDASIMDGHTLRVGAVGALRNYLHPISVARQVMERLPHVFLVGEGAERFAAECGAEIGETSPDAVDEWQTWLRAHMPADILAQWPNVPLAPWVNMTADPRTSRDTTIYIAQDASGNIATGVSTSGWRYKYPGRLGDSPVIGAGSYADNRYGAACCTGVGELAIRAGTARSVVLYMKMGMTLEQACREAADDVGALSRPYTGGLLIYAINVQGKPCVVSTEKNEVSYEYWSEE
jgi:beta-aspartyl-peptidase (threonine type)